MISIAPAVAAIVAAAGRHTPVEVSKEDKERIEFHMETFIKRYFKLKNKLNKKQIDIDYARAEYQKELDDLVGVIEIILIRSNH